MILSRQYLILKDYRCLENNIIIGNIVFLQFQLEAVIKGTIIGERKIFSLLFNVRTINVENVPKWVT